VSEGSIGELKAEHTATGIYVAISPKEIMTLKTTLPTNKYAIKVPTGPDLARAAPLPMKRPVPIVPPGRL
jgi:hypothetical protein